MKKVLTINDYANDINLFDKYSFELSEENDKEFLLEEILCELSEDKNLRLGFIEKRRLLHGILNTLPPNSLSQYSLYSLNQLLNQELKEKIKISLNDILKEHFNQIGETKIAVWKGDITTLKIDAIVNAANSQMLGCFQPLHSCIDNAIHSAAGVQLRDDCNTIIKKQGFLEPTGFAKITRAYNLPSEFVIHTVGPIVQGNVTDENKNDLANSYINCLEICKEIEEIKSIAFCCISTGVFGYPQSEAANLAYKTVTKWLEHNPNIIENVVFNVFSEKDEAIYNALVIN